MANGGFIPRHRTHVAANREMGGQGRAATRTLPGTEEYDPALSVQPLWGN